MVGEQYQPQQPQYVVQPAPQPQYGAPQPGVVQPGYGAATPIVPQQVMPAEVKWSGLSTGGAFRIPVIAFIGRLTDMVFDTQSQFGLRIIEKYDQVQILESPVPWPWATIDVSIKYSDREESGWGRHVASAKAIGLAVQAASFEQAKAELVGRIFELRQTLNESYGENKSGQTMSGDVWRFVRTVDITGQAAVQQPQYVMPPPVATVQPVPINVAATPQPVPVVQPVAPLPAQPVQPIAPVPAVAPAPAPVPAPAPTMVAPPGPAGAFDVTLAPTDTAPVRGKKLLHGKMLNEFLGVALIDPVVKADPPFVNTIFDQSFIVGLKASGQATQGADGRFQIIS